MTTITGISIAGNLVDLDSVHAALSGTHGRSTVTDSPAASSCTLTLVGDAIPPVEISDLLEGGCVGPDAPGWHVGPGDACGDLGPLDASERCARVGQGQAEGVPVAASVVGEELLGPALDHTEPVGDGVGVGQPLDDHAGTAHEPHHGVAGLGVEVVHEHGHVAQLVGGVCLAGDDVLGSRGGVGLEGELRGQGAAAAALVAGDAAG